MVDTQAMQNRIQTLKNSVSHMNKTIAEKQTKNIFLRPISHPADDAEIALSEGLQYPALAAMFFRAAEHDLGEAERRLKYRQEMVAAYGLDLAEIG
jgi:hypothetical protein